MNGMGGERRVEGKQSDQCSLFGGLNLALPYTPVPQAWLISIIHQNLWQAGHRSCSKKKAFLAAQEAWNHLVRAGITQMNKLWVGILILGKHLSLERERAKATAADSFSLSVPLLTASSHIHPLSSAPFVFAHFRVFLCSHLIRPGNVLSCFSKHLLGIRYSSSLPQKWDEGKPWRPFFIIMITFFLLYGHRLGKGVVIQQGSKQSYQLVYAPTKRLPVMCHVLCV